MRNIAIISSQFGYFIGTYPTQTIGVALILCFSILITFVFHPPIIETDIRHGFVHRNSRAVLEFQRFAEFYNSSWMDIEMMVVLIKPKYSNDKVLRITPQLCDQIKQLELHIQSFEVPNSVKPIKYNEFRVPGGNLNYFFDAFKFGYDLLTRQNKTDGSVVLTYPQGSIFGHHVSLASHFFGVKLVENYTEKGLPTAMESAATISLFFMVKADGILQKYRLRHWQLALNELSETGNYSDLFVFYIYGDQIANAEMERGNLKSLKLFAIGAFIMIVYIAFILRMFSIKSKILLTLASIFSPLLATIVSFSLAQWFGISITSINGFIPLLMIGIGVDDAFLLIHAWQDCASISDKRNRMASVITAAGPSISITTITNILAFAVGAITASPTMSSFCSCMLIAITLDYILELTIFAPVLALTTKFERGDQSEKRQSFCYSSQCWILLSRFVISKVGLVTIAAMQIILYIVATVGIMQMKANFDPTRAFLSDSKLITCVEIVNSIYREYVPTVFVVNNPPDISNSTQYDEFMELVDRLEELPSSYGAERTLLWLRDYVKYLEKKRKRSGSHNTNFTYQYVPEFLTSKFLADKNVLHYHIVDRHSVIVDSFLFIMVSCGKGGWTRRAHFVDPIRSILDEYPHYNVTLFDYDGTIFDLISNVKHELIKAVIITMVCIMLICYIFITKLLSTVVASFTIFSIFYCLIGILSLIGLDLDPITMIVVLIAIGFSVDFTAHTCYHFYHYDNSAHNSNKCNDYRTRKLADIYFVVGEPIVEGAASTILCMLPVFAISTELIKSLAKTIVTVILLGIFHAIIIVPAILSLRINKTDKNEGSIMVTNHNTTVQSECKNETVM
uniref:BMA-PTR-13 n=1 Tax=Brugia malayi TaxID=6279 RepID=A0A0H5S503_BRUMA|nr:BMA-PTR-13 [Brugia malayi]